MNTQNNMLINVRKGFLGLATLALLLGTMESCKKSTTTSPTQPTANTLPPVSGADAVLAAVNVKTTQTVPIIGSIDVVLGTGVSAFGTLTGTPSYVNVGTISLNDTALQIQSNNAYIYNPSQSSGVSNEFSGTIVWKVQGGSGFAAFNKTVNMGFPDIGTITSSTSAISTSSPYTLTADFVTNSDSVVFQIAGSHGNKTVIVAGNTTSHTFSAADMAVVGSGYAILQVAPYRYQLDQSSGKKIYFVNETAVSKSVQIP